MVGLSEWSEAAASAAELFSNDIEATFSGVTVFRGAHPGDRRVTSHMSLPMLSISTLPVLHWMSKAADCGIARRRTKRNGKVRPRLFLRRRP